MEQLLPYQTNPSICSDVYIMSISVHTHYIAAAAAAVEFGHECTMYISCCITTLNHVL